MYYIYNIIHTHMCVCVCVCVYVGAQCVAQAVRHVDEMCKAAHSLSSAWRGTCIYRCIYIYMERRIMICMCVCVYVCMYVCTYIHIYTNICVLYMNICIVTSAKLLGTSRTHSAPGMRRRACARDSIQRIYIHEYM